MATQIEPQWLRDRRSVFASCAAFGLSRGERLEVAAVILNREVDSFVALGPRELARLRDAFDGAVLVANIQIEKRRGTRAR